MANISIFARNASIAKHDKHLLRGSSVIRAEQIAPRIGAKLNPESGYENDVCIYVKPWTPNLYSGKIKLAKNSYIDVIDSDNEVLFLGKNPKIGGIVCSQVDYNRVVKFLRNKIVLIPQHHCNFERVKRTRDKVEVAGVIGAPGLFYKLPEGLEQKLDKIGLKLLNYSKFRNRQDVVDFYKKIDIQIIWRPWSVKLSNPLKLINASSFGIPTVAYEEETFSEVGGCHLPVKTVDELIDQALLLKNSPEVYAKYRDLCLDKAEKYHIDRIVSIYKKLGEE
jgi:hypothetical protein